MWSMHAVEGMLRKECVHKRHAIIGESARLTCSDPQTLNKCVGMCAVMNTLGQKRLTCRDTQTQNRCVGMCAVMNTLGQNRLTFRETQTLNRCVGMSAVMNTHRQTNSQIHVCIGMHAGMIVYVDERWD